MLDILMVKMVRFVMSNNLNYLPSHKMSSLMGGLFPVGRLVCFEFLTQNEKIVCMTISKAIGRTFVNNGRTIDVKISPIG